MWLYPVRDGNGTRVFNAFSAEAAVDFVQHEKWPDRPNGFFVWPARERR